MTDADGFLATIAAAKSRELPAALLVMADWCEERGDGERAAKLRDLAGHYSRMKRDDWRLPFAPFRILRDLCLDLLPDAYLLRPWRKRRHKQTIKRILERNRLRYVWLPQRNALAILYPHTHLQRRAVEGIQYRYFGASMPLFGTL